MTTLDRYVRRLELLAASCGLTVVRHVLDGHIVGRVEARRIVLRTGLTREHQLLTLVHELTHWIVHCDVSPPINRTICEYEAEAVERWVAAVLRVTAYDGETCDLESLTDGLLATSVERVRRAARLLIRAALGRPLHISGALEPQPAVQIDDSTGEEVVFNNELRGMRDFVRFAQPL